MTRQFFAKKPVSQLLKEAAGEHGLWRVLGPVQLTSLGLGAIIGVGIFVTTGTAARDHAGPSLILSFVVAAVTCAFAALCYSEFASMTPVAGSAYTYAFASIGELAAWIIGWDLILEYAVSASAVVKGASAYFQDLLGVFHLSLPWALTGAPIDNSAELGRLALTGQILDLPALLITAGVTILLVRGIRESASFNAAMVILKVAIVLFVIVVGAFYFDLANWEKFFPYGPGGIVIFNMPVWGQLSASGRPLGMMAGAGIIFFSYIGFDAVSTHAEEARNPQRDIPIGIIASLVISTVLYMAVTAVLTGMVRYDRLDEVAPVSVAFGKIGLRWAQALISFGATIGIISVVLVTILSQARILMSMARDGLPPRKFFGAIHERFGTPWKSTILTGAFVGLLSALLPLNVLFDLVNIGTLLAFIIVCAAVLIMRKTHPDAERPFRTPLVPLVPVLGILACLVLMFTLPTANWWRLLVWLLIGLAIYLAYGRRHSIMAPRIDKALIRADEILTPVVRKDVRY